MTTADLDTLTDQLAKSDSSSFPLAEKLSYYNIGYGLLYSRIIAEQEDNYEEEDTKDTVASHSDYKEEARIHHVNWLKINYGDGFIPARYVSEAELIARYGTELETVLANWPASDPIHNFKGKHHFVYPAPTASQAGADRLKVSQELLPADLATNDTPDLLENFHYLLAVYAARTWLDEDDPLWAKRNQEWNDGTVAMLSTMFPRDREADIVATTNGDDGSTY